MKIVVSLLLTGIASIAVGASPPNFAGQYADNKFLNGQGVFEMSVQQNGSSVFVSFSAVYSDGHGAAPEATGKGSVTGKGTAEFKFEDSFKNSGTGTISRSGEDIIVSINPTRVAEPRCLQFYRNNIRLKRVTPEKSKTTSSERPQRQQRPGSSATVDLAKPSAPR